MMLPYVEKMRGEYHIIAPDLTGHGSNMGSFEGAEQMYSAADIDSDVMKKFSDSMSRTDRKALACMVHTCNSFKYEQSINRN